MNAPLAKLEPPLIVHVTRQFHPSRGGLEDVVFNLCRQLISRGYRVRVVTCNRVFSSPEAVLPAREVIEGIEVVRIPYAGSTRYPLAPAVLRHVRDADLVHVHAVDFFFDALSWLRPLHGRPLIATTHGGFFHTTRFALIKKVWFSTVTRLSCLGYRRIICCSASDAALFAKIAGRRTLTIENGANIGKFAGCAASSLSKRIVTIGRFSVNKRLDHLIAAMARLVEIDPDWHLDIIGVASDLTETDLQRHIERWAVKGHVSIHTDLPDDAVAGLISRASLFASASEYEGFGLVAIEAMSAGLLPVLNSNDAYCQLAAKHPLLAVTDFADAAAAADAIQTAFDRLRDSGAPLRRQLIDEAQAYSWETVAGHYVEAYVKAVPKLAAVTTPVRGL